MTRGTTPSAACCPSRAPLADYGQRLLKGVQLALDSFHQGSNFTLLIEDTANDPLTAVSGLDTLAANPEVMAVIGPPFGPPWPCAWPNGPTSCACPLSP